MVAMMCQAVEASGEDSVLVLFLPPVLLFLGFPIMFQA